MRTKETGHQMLTMTDLKQRLKQILFRTQNAIKKKNKINKPKTLITELWMAIYSWVNLENRKKLDQCGGCPWAEQTKTSHFLTRLLSVMIHVRCMQQVSNDHLSSVVWQRSSTTLPKSQLGPKSNHRSELVSATSLTH